MDKILETAAETLAEQAPSVKVCTKCLCSKAINEFFRRNGTKLGRRSWCKSCCKEYLSLPEVKTRQLAYHEAYNAREDVRRRKRDYMAERNKSNDAKLKRIAYLEDYSKRPASKLVKKNYMRSYVQRPEIKELRRAYRKRRCEANPSFRLEMNIRGRLRLAIKGKLKSARTFELIGCDIDFLRRWIEAKWKPGMTWQNYGFNGWHVDHIMPCAMFDLSDPIQQRTCFRWTNLQPLWAHENMSKSDKVES